MKRYTISNIKSYLVGNLRYFFYYSPYGRWMIRDHIRQQIDWRISVMEPACYNNGSCEICGCETTALQMANKMCDKPCYPPMLDERRWQSFSKGWTICEAGYQWQIVNGRLMYKKEELCG